MSLFEASIFYSLLFKFIIYNVSLPFLYQAIYEKGARDEIEEFIYKLCDITGDGILGRYKILVYFCD